MANEPELLPCPFCGGEATETRPKDVHCRDELCAGFKMRHCGANQWNTRTQPTPEQIRALVPELRWSQWGNEWDANTPFGSLTVKIDGNTGFYVYQGPEKLTDGAFFGEAIDRSTPTDLMAASQECVTTRFLRALGMEGGE